jgi:hypothetical protein
MSEQRNSTSAAALSPLPDGHKGQLSPRVRDHSNIARAQASLGVAGGQEVNELIVGEATRLGFGQVEMVSSDTTVQEPAIGYPNEAGIRRGVAQRLSRSRVKEKGLQAVEAGKERVPSVCQDPQAERSTPASTRCAERGVDRAQPRGDQAGGPQRQESGPISGQENGADDRGECHLAAPDWALAADRSRGEGQELTRGDHPGAGDCQKQGRQARGVWVEGAGQSHRRGYVFGRVVEAGADERAMPIEAMKDYQRVFGAQAVPKMSVYDRGGSAPKTIEALKRQGIEEVGIPPRGKAKGCVAQADQPEVRSQRGKTEGVIDTLKSRKYGFNHRTERSNETLIAAGQRVMVCLNLNTLMRDVVGKEKKAQVATA